MAEAVTRTIHILLVEDNPADVNMMQETLEESDVAATLHVVSDGEEAMAFLNREGKFAAAPRPDLVLLDIGLPKKNGLEVLSEIKGDPALLRIPVIILTTSKAEEDILKSYDLHANSYITKPVHLDGFLQLVRLLKEFWFGTVKLPPR
jgi:two-component system, chemotaxis family, response regulator Rcp1